MKGTRSQLAALLAAVVATSMTFLDATAITPALPAMAVAMDVSSARSLWIVGACALPLAILLLPAGALADRIGHRPTLAAGLSMFAIASIVTATAPGMTWLIVGRVTQGIAGAMMAVGSLAVVTAAYPAQQRGRAIGAWSAGCAAAMVAGPLLGGTLAEAGWWRGIFLVHLPVALLAMLCLRHSPSMAASQSTPPQTPRLMPAPLYKRPIICGTLLCALMLHTATYGLLLILPLALIGAASYAADHAAAAQMPILLLLILVSPVAGWWMDHRGPRGPVSIGCVLAVIGLLWLWLGGVGLGPGDYAARLLGPFVLIGAGVGFAIVPLSTTVMGQVDTSELGAAAAINALIARLAAPLAIVVFGGVLIGHGAEWTAAETTASSSWAAAFAHAMALAAALWAAVGVVSALILPGAATDRAVDSTPEMAR